MSEAVLTGGCQCGAVRYAVAAEPLRLYVCHCRECQKQSGSAFGMSLIDVAVHPGEARFSVSNESAGWRELCRRLGPIGARAIGIEPSGGYERGVIVAMLNAGLPVRSVNPWKLRQFAKAAGWLAKNDRHDAQAIACFVATLPTRAVQHDPARRHLVELVTARRQIVDLRQEIGNQIEHLADPELRRMQERRIRQTDADLVRLDRRIAEPSLRSPRLPGATTCFVRCRALVRFSPPLCWRCCPNSAAPQTVRSVPWLVSFRMTSTEAG